ncbi:unnamed protein product [Symbiodinium sp. CCMP2592]|nr:unnamed protein product [Symbiodinium sp. CCMP2592]CAE7746769.1 unnamed protein product [Symbiodinium sp. CCMP2592]
MADWYEKEEGSHFGGSAAVPNEKPGRKKTKTAETEENEKPRGKKTKTAETEENEKPRGKKTKTAETEENEKPQRKKTKTAETEKEKPRGKKTKTAETDENEKPRGKKTKTAETDENEKPRGKKTKTAETDENEKPSGKKTKTDEVEDKSVPAQPKTSPKKGQADDDEESEKATFARRYRGKEGGFAAAKFDAIKDCFQRKVMPQLSGPVTIYEDPFWTYCVKLMKEMPVDIDRDNIVSIVNKCGMKYVRQVIQPNKP